MKQKKKGILNILGEQNTFMNLYIVQEEFEDTKGVTRVRKLKQKTTQQLKENGKGDKQRSKKTQEQN